jgi:ammonium transporter, Amt family
MPTRSDHQRKAGGKFMIRKVGAACTVAGVIGTAWVSPAFAQTDKIDGADTAWMIVATSIVLMMTIPGLALFYAGMVRKKNVLATMAQSLAATAFVSVLWVAFGYSLVFTGDGALLGSTSRLFLAGMGMDSISPFAKSIPEALFMLYQMAFAVITVALVVGSVADRMRFAAFLLFSALWLAFVYVPIAHWVWGGGFLGSAGLLDFAGGTVVHINAGVAGLTAALLLGPRRGYGSENLAPFDLSMAVVGTGLLWVGWFGFNGGSALGANSRAVMAITATHLAACGGVLTWMAIEWRVRGKPSVLGMISGAVAGLGTITPASGYVLPWHGLVIGVIAGAVCYYACTALKARFRYDDSLDVFGVHGIGGLTGTLLCGVFATAAVSIGPDAPQGYAGLIEGNYNQVLIQLFGVVVTMVWSGAITAILLKAVAAVTALRATQDEEREGLDISIHGEAIQ